METELESTAVHVPNSLGGYIKPLEIASFQADFVVAKHMIDTSPSSVITFAGWNK